MIVAGLFFASMGVFVKLGAAQFSSAEMVFYRSLFGVLVVLSGAYWTPRKPGRWLLLGMATKGGRSRGPPISFATISTRPQPPRP